jgi:hypothetical protein
LAHELAPLGHPRIAHPQAVFQAADRDGFAHVDFVVLKRSSIYRIIVPLIWMLVVSRIRVFLSSRNARFRPTGSGHLAASYRFAD